MKLSKAQEKAYNYILSETVDTKTFEEHKAWYMKNWNEFTEKDEKWVNTRMKYAELGCVHITEVNTRTLKKLEEYGLIKIYHSTGYADFVKVLKREF